VIRPQAAMPMAVPSISRLPRANSGWRQIGSVAWDGGGGDTSGLSQLALQVYFGRTLPLPATDFVTLGLPR
jgi:hypothetical protein